MDQIHSWTQSGYWLQREMCYLAPRLSWEGGYVGPGAAVVQGGLKMTPALDPAHPVSRSWIDGQWESCPRDTGVNASLKLWWIKCKYNRSGNNLQADKWGWVWAHIRAGSHYHGWLLHSLTTSLQPCWKQLVPPILPSSWLTATRLTWFKLSQSQKTHKVSGAAALTALSLRGLCHWVSQVGHGKITCLEQYHPAG